MKKKRISLFISTLIIICLFGVAASCNLCGVPVKIGDNSSTNTNTSTTKTTSKSTVKDQQADQTNETEQITVEESDTSEDVDEITSDNEEGSSEDSMEDISEPTIVTINLVGDESGSVSVDGELVNRAEIFVGHNENGKHYRAYMSFNISDLSGKTIDTASLKLASPQIFEPRAELRDFRVGIIEYGTGLLSSSVVTLPGNPIASLPNTTGNVDLSNDKLVNGLQSSINDGKTRFQITLYWSSEFAYVDFANHGNLYWKENVSLLVTYF